ncbi:MAG: Lar family restriction alleviation protein [Synergistaceae bacterium]|nr:Lar family restriction alleviation protein [Synergistaceae bacterium]
MSKRTLKPCPFCGGHAEVTTSYEYEESYHAVCEDCKARSGWCRTPEDARKLWNMRPEIW